jgi:hypothetical protein
MRADMETFEESIHNNDKRLYTSHSTSDLDSMAIDKLSQESLFKNFVSGVIFPKAIYS